MSAPAPSSEQRPEVAISTAGKGGRAMVLIHGVGTNRSIWSRALPALPSGAWSPRSTCRASATRRRPARGWTIDGVAEQIALALVAEVDPPLRPGRLVARRRRRPRPRRPQPGAGRPARALRSRRVQAGTGAAAVRGGGARGAAASVRRTTGLRLADVGFARRAILAGTVADGSRLDPDTARLVLRASEGAISLGPAFRAAAGANLGEVATRLPFRFGLVWGSLDRVIPAHTAERVLALRPDTVLELIPGVGHIPHLEEPDRFNAALERVLERLA